MKCNASKIPLEEILSWAPYLLDLDLSNNPPYGRPHELTHNYTLDYAATDHLTKANDDKAIEKTPATQWLRLQPEVGQKDRQT